MGHSFAQPLGAGNGSYAQLAHGDCDTLLVLGHGFGGSAVSTWRGLRSLATGTPETASADIVSYGYNSTNAPAANSAVLLGEFMNGIIRNLPEWSNLGEQVTGHGRPRDYQRIIIVAHSLGAAVSRRMLLNAIDAGDDWPARARLLLFAPAHMGTRLLADRALLGGGLGGLVNTLLTGWKLGRPALDDLLPDSDFLKALISDTETQLGNGWSDTLKAKQIVFGELESVVKVARFCEDPPHKVWREHTHTSICKAEEAAKFVSENLA